MTTSFADLPPSVWAEATDDELDIIIAGLEAETTALDRDWILTPRQQAAEDLCTNLDPGKGHEILYGGAAGGGKSQWMLWHLYHLALRYPGFSGLLIRRTFAQLTRTHIQMSFRRFDRSLCKFNQVSKTWRFANGSTIEFGYLDKASDVYNYDSAEYDCVGPSTLILMADGTHRRIEFIRAGDMVQTLEGPRRVTRCQSVGLRPCALLTPTDARGAVAASLHHRVLDSEGQWRTPEDFAVSSAGDRSGCRASSGSRRETPTPDLWFGQLTLRGPAPRSAGSGIGGARRRRAQDRDLGESELRGFRADSRLRSRSRDGRLRGLREDDRVRTPSRGGVAVLDPSVLGRVRRWLGDRARTRTRSRARRPYFHPYTKALVEPIEAVHPAWVRMVPAGEQVLWDMTVEGANHYVSYGGIVHSNCVCFDELTEWATPDNYLYLFSRIRTEMHLVEQGLVGHMVAATNPGRAGGAWVKARFIDFAEPMQRVDVADAESDAVTTRVFVPAKIDDNPHFGRRQYRANLMNVDAKRRKQLEDGDWDAIEGQYFDEWDRALHVREPFEIPQWWTKIRGLDWGITNPMCCLWAAFDGDGVCYIYRELYGTGMLNTIQARRVNEMTRPDEGVLYTMADPSIWANTGNGMNTAEQYARAGLRCRKANNARVDGWARVREFLRVDEASGMPRLVIFNHCRNLIRTLPMLVHESKNPEDLDTTGEDHAADAMRYLLMSRPKVTRSPKREAATLEAEHAEAVRQRRHDRSSRSVMHPELGRW